MNYVEINAILEPGMPPLDASRHDTGCRALLEFVATHAACHAAGPPQGSFTPIDRETALVQVRCGACRERFVAQLDTATLKRVLRTVAHPRGCLELVLDGLSSSLGR